jgi:hypothetical protein
MRIFLGLFVIAMAILLVFLGIFIGFFSPVAAIAYFVVMAGFLGTAVASAVRKSRRASAPSSAHRRG